MDEPTGFPMIARCLGDVLPEPFWQTHVAMRYPADFVRVCLLNGATPKQIADSIKEGNAHAKIDFALCVQTALAQMGQN